MNENADWQRLGHEFRDLTSAPPCSLRVRDTKTIPFAVACALERMASASPDSSEKEREREYM